MAEFNIKYFYPRTVSQLPELSPKNSNEDNQLKDSDFFGVSHTENFVDSTNKVVKKYSSRKITAENLAVYYQDKILEIFGENFNFPNDEYVSNKVEQKVPNTEIYDFRQSRRVYRAFLHSPPEDSSALPPDDNWGRISCRNVIHFEKTPLIDGIVKDYTATTETKYKAVNIQTAQWMLAYVSPFLIDSNSEFISKEFNVENAFIDDIHEAPTTESEKHNRYLFRMVGYRSVNTWTAPESGIFTCWGWVDMRSDPYAGSNCNAWIALEGLIKGKWRILQLQPFDKNNGMQLSYVGFTFPVSKGLELRITSGFRVGTNSNKYQSANGSLANHIANCFVGGIYKANVFEQNVPSDVRDSVRSPAPVFDFHEEELTDKRSTVAELKQKLNAVIAQLNAMSDRAKGIEPVAVEKEDSEEAEPSEEKEDATV